MFLPFSKAKIHLGVQKQIWGAQANIALLPLENLYCGVMKFRRYAHQRGWLHSERLPVPVLVVGNITVGGTGKTPLVLWLAKFLETNGWKPGILSRGYGGKIGNKPREVFSEDDPKEVGDEPLLLARRSKVPVAVCTKRTSAGNLLISRHGCTCLICDDGLQHYALERDVEIVVTDRARGFGNGHCLPAGPLREPISRMAKTHLQIAHGVPLAPGEYAMSLELGLAVSIGSPKVLRPLSDFQTTPVHAVAGIGHPDRFFDALRAKGLNIIPHPFPDHFLFQNFDFGDCFPIMMTEKDAVKCSFLSEGWYVPAEAVLPLEFGKKVLDLLP
ncbi:Tetraacyldisaccharide 4'-kinase [Gammaproteobacteria bacterium]